MDDIIPIIGQYYIERKNTEFKDFVYKINWQFLNYNKNAIHLLEKNLDKIN